MYLALHWQELGHSYLQKNKRLNSLCVKHLFCKSVFFMAKRDSIDQWSWFYAFLQIFIVRPIYNYYYRKIKIINADRIPKGQPVILAPNHQNALMDALAFVEGINFQTVFLAHWAVSSVWSHWIWR